jgi:hypothetical protein
MHSRLGSEGKSTSLPKFAIRMCRERALLDTDRRAFWLAKADEWAQRANDEIASLF